MNSCHRKPCRCIGDLPAPPRPSFLARNGDLIALAAMVVIWAVGLFGIWSLEG